MSARQNLAVTVAFDQVAAEYEPLVQIAGMRTKIIDVCRSDCSTPDELRRSLVCQLRDTLPLTVARSIRATPSPQMSGDWLAQTEAKVRDEVIRQAHQSETLRPVITRDRTGREQTEFYGKKQAWMTAYSSPPRLMTAIDGHPVRIPTVL